jgi:catechol 2,3-dioxygenase-like lactoylglutathione lyase family enzyme
MDEAPQFTAAFPYQEDVLALPVGDLEKASEWYSRHFGMKEVERRHEPLPSVILERDGVRLGFAVNGGDPTQDGAAIRVTNLQGIRAEFEARGINVGDERVDEREGKKFRVFFVVAPDGLCFYIHELLHEAAHGASVSS